MFIVDLFNNNKFNGNIELDINGNLRLFETCAEQNNFFDMQKDSNLLHFFDGPATSVGIQTGIATTNETRRLSQNTHVGFLEMVNLPYSFS